MMTMMKVHCLAEAERSKHSCCDDCACDTDSQSMTDGQISPHIAPFLSCANIFDTN